MNQQNATYQQTRWSLADLVPSGGSAQLDAVFQQLREQIDHFAGETRPKLNEDISGETFMGIVQQIERINREAYHL